MSEKLLVIDGATVAAERSFDVIDPSTGRVYATAPDCSPDQLELAMTSAHRAFASWSLDDEARRSALRRAADLVDASAGELTRVLTQEQGKPLRNSRREFSNAAKWLRYFADLEVEREVVQDDAEGFVEIIRKPLGVVSAITPWNFPISLAMWKLGPALRAGNTVVLKPSPYTPLTTLGLGAVLQDAFPPGVLNVVSGVEPLGEAMVAHPLVRKVSFTGSTNVGKLVAAGAASDLKRVTLELGGNDAAIVLPDADPAKIAHSMFWSAFNNNGQICLAVKRVYAHDAIYSDLVDALAEIARGTVVGDGLDEESELGPLNNEPQFNRVSSLVSDAVNGGARAASGGAPLDRDGYFYAPTILADARDGMRIVDEEQFGPALPIVRFTDVEEAVAHANDSVYGLTASVWSDDVDHATTIAERLDTGQVSINVHGGGVRVDLPFGGHKWSGIGVENGPWGLKGFTDLQVISRPPRRDGAEQRGFDVL